MGCLIRDIRKNKSISQEKLAEKTGLDRTFISSIETGKTNSYTYIHLQTRQSLDIKISALLKLYEEKIVHEDK